MCMCDNLNLEHHPTKGYSPGEASINIARTQTLRSTHQNINMRHKMVDDSSVDEIRSFEFFLLFFNIITKILLGVAHQYKRNILNGYLLSFLKQRKKCIKRNTKLKSLTNKC